MENQIIEWKESWHDEYLKWICGFANAQGGVLEIGRNDRGEIIELANAKKLLEDLPNKIRTTMGIVADVNLNSDSGKKYIKITVPAHYNAISYRGKYYYRSGSTNQELSGYALDELLLGKYGKTWDSVPAPYVKNQDFYSDAFDVFRKKAVASKRLLPEDVDCTDVELLQVLNLTEGEYILRAASLLFHRNPERWCLGSYVKIGYFINDADLLYQDEINGPLLTIPDRIMDLIFTKYFKGLIHYEGIQRIDEYPMPREALREAILNAVVHKDYSTGNPIHIKIYDDKVIIYNDCQLPINIMPEKLLRGIGSKPHNPLIANTFFRSGQIEAWGRGIEKMKKGCIKDGLVEPEFEISPTIFSICFHIRNNSTPRVVEKTGVDERTIGSNGTINGTINSDKGPNGTINGTINSDKGSNGTISSKNSNLRLMNAISDNPAATYDELAVLLDIPRRTVSREIKRLRESGEISREGAKKNGRWVVKTQK